MAANGWDQGQTFYSDPFTELDGAQNERTTLLRDFREFLLNYREEQLYNYRCGNTTRSGRLLLQAEEREREEREREEREREGREERRERG